jgi:hypothetical protein
MLCALTVRKLKPGTFEQFVEEFRPPTGSGPTGWVAFRAMRSVKDENEVITFGFFDGTLDELNESQQEHNYRGRVDSVSQFVESVGTSGVYEIVIEETI